MKIYSRRFFLSLLFALVCVGRLAAQLTFDPDNPPTSSTPPTERYHEFTGVISGNDQWTKGPKTMMVFLVQPSDAPEWTNPKSHATLESELLNASANFYRASYHQTWFGPKRRNGMDIPMLKVTPVLELPRSVDFYRGSFGGLQSDCIAAARALGPDWQSGGVNDPYNYDRWVVMSNRDLTSSTGLAYVRGRFAWTNGDLDGKVAEHEIGHNWGVYHANSWYAPSGVPDDVHPRSDLRQNGEYGDGWDLMGGGTSSQMFNPQFRQDLHFLETGRGEVVEVTTSGRYRIHNYLHRDARQPETLTRALVVPTASNTAWGRVVLGFGHLNGTDGGWSRTDFNRNAVTVHSNLSSGSNRIDTTPLSRQGDADEDDSSIKIGRTYSEGPDESVTPMIDGFHVTPVLRGSTLVNGEEHEWIEVEVHYESDISGNQAPAASFAQSIFTGAQPGVPFDLTVSASDPDNDDLAYDWDFGDDSYNIVNAATQTKTWVEPGFYRVKVTVSDMKGETTTAEAWVNVGGLAFRAPDTPAATLGGLAYRYYEGPFQQLPAFSNLLPVAEGTVNGFNLSPSLRNDDFALLFDGYLDVPAQDVYSFEIDAKDGVRLWIGDTVVIENDGIQSAARTTAGSLALEAGLHPVRLEYFHRNGSEALEVRWGTLTQPLAVIGSAALQQNDPSLTTLPQISFLSPEEGETFLVGSNVLLTVDVDDPALVEAVKFFANGSYIGEDASAPYALLWENVSVGEQQVVAVAVDANGYGVSTPARTLQVESPPPTRSVGINFAGTDSYASPHDPTVVGFADRIGAVYAEGNWNNFTIEDDQNNGNVYENLIDNEGFATPVRVEWQGHQQTVLGKTAADTSTGNGRMFHGYAGALRNWEASPWLTARNVPYIQYDVYVYFDYLNTSSIDTSTRQFRITTPDGTVNLAPPKYGQNSLDRNNGLGDYPDYDTWVGYKESTATAADAPTAERLGNYVVFRNITDPEFRVEVNTGSGEATGSRFMNGVQIVEVEASLPNLRLSVPEGGWQLTEGGSGLSYTVRPAIDPGETITVSIDGAGEMTAQPDTLSFDSANWDQPQIVTLQALDDADVEGDHSALLTHSIAATGVYAGLAAKETGVTIADNDTPRVSVAVASNAEEGPTSVSGGYQFVRDNVNAFGSPLTVHFSLAGDADPADYSLSGLSVNFDAQTGAGTVVIPAGAAQGFLTLTPIDDAEVEASENAVLTIVEDAGYAVGQSSATLMITDDDAANYFTQFFGAGTFGEDFDLENRKITFTPDGSGSYTAAVEDVTVYPNSNTLGDQFVAGSFDDAFYSVNLPATIYGETYNSFYISTNGYLTFGQSDSAWAPTINQHFSRKRVSVFFADQYVTDGLSTIYAGETGSGADKRTVVTFNDLHVRGNSTAPNRYNAQVELWDSGVITITWLNCHVGQSVIVGLSDRDTGTPGTFAETNLSELGAGEVNRTPRFASLPPTRIVEGGGYSHTLYATDADDDALVFSATTLPGWLTLADQGDGTATLSGTAPVPGSYPVELAVSDGAASDTLAFTLDVTAADNNAPVFTSSPVTHVLVETGYSYGLTATDTDGDALSFAVVEVPGWMTLTDHGDGTATLSGTAPRSQLEAVPVVVSVSDGVDAALQSFNLIYDRPPRITLLQPAQGRVELPHIGLDLHVETAIEGFGEAVQASWSVAAAPAGGTATFDDTASVSPRVSFDAPGRYTLELTADNGLGVSTARVEVFAGNSAGTVLDQGLIGYWRMNETGGTVLADASGNGNDATINLNNNFNPGVTGYDGLAVSLGGNSNSADASVGMPAQVTFSGWFQAEASPALRDNSLFAFLDGSNNTRSHLRMNSGDTRLHFVSHHVNDPGLWRLERDIPSGEWIHVVLAYDGSSTQNAPEASINGESVSVTLLQAPGDARSTGTFRIGSTGGNWNSWNGRLDEFRLYDRIVPEADRALLMNPGALNRAPDITVEDVGAGPDQTVSLGATVADDGLPAVPGEVTVQWTQEDGPDQGVFALDTFADTDFTTGPFSGTYVLRLTATDGGSVVSATMQVNSEGGEPRAPTIVSQPSDVLVPLGDSATFSVNVDAEPVPDFQWQFNGVDIPGATGLTLTVEDAAPADEGDYRVVMTNSEGSATSDAASLTILYPPTITSQPSDQTVDVGTPVSFSVTATGDGSLGYQWFKDDVAINGATASTYSLTSPGVVDSGSYRVAVTNGGGTTLSDPADLSVNGLVPTVTEWPTPNGLTYPQTLGDLVLTGGAASVAGTFEVVDPATRPGAGTLDVSLRFQPDDAVNYVPVETTVPVSVAAAELTVQADSHLKLVGETDPVFTWQLLSGSLADGDSFSGTPQREAGETAGEYVIGQGSLTAGANYALTFIPGTLSIVEEQLFTVGYDANGGTGSVPTGGDHADGSSVDVVFSPEPTRSGFTFVGWKRDANGPTAEFKSGETTSFVISEDTTLYAHWFSPWELQEDFNDLTGGGINGQNGWTGAGTATVVADPEDAGNQVFRFGPGSNDEAGKALSSTIGSSDTATLFYRFYVPAGGSRINQQLRLPGDYFIRLKWDTDPSEPVLWLFDASMSGDTKQQVEQSIARDTWYKMWVAIESGTGEYRIYIEGGDHTQPTLVTVANMGSDPESHPFNPGTIDAILFKGWNNAPMLYDDFYLLMDQVSLDDPRPSAPAPVQPPVITTQPLPLEVTEGDNAAFTVAASGEEPLTYQWIKDGVDLAGETASLLTLSSVTPSDAGLYRVRVSNAGGDVLSDEVALTVTPAASPGILAFADASYTFDANAGTVTVPVSRSGGSEGAVSVQVNHVDGSAEAGTHFDAVNQTLHWADGESGEKSVTLTLTAQPALVGELEFTLALSGVTGGATLDQPQQAAVTLTGPGESVAVDFDTHNSYGQVQVVTESDGSKTLTLTAGGNANPWDSAFRWPIGEPLSNGEILWLRIVGYASSVPGEETGEMRVPTLVELQNSPYTRYLDGSMRFGPQSREQILIGEMTEDLAADTAYINMHLGGLEGTLHIESVELVRYPPGTDPADLPRSPMVWEGMEPDAAWRADAETAIQTHRTDDLRIRVLDAEGNPVQGATVTARQQTHAFAFGTAVNNRPMLDPDYADGPTYRQKLVENFEWATPENSLKWQAEDWGNWEAGKTTADQGQATVDKILELGLIPRGHVLLWPSYDNSPSDLVGLDNAALAAEIETRVRSMSAQYAGTLPEWDALNEVYSNHDFPDLLGNQLLEDVFTWARAEDPDARFFINDFNILTNGNLNTDHKDAYYSLISSLQTSGVPLGGIGMQGHFGGTMPGVSEMQATLDRFATFGLPIRITEYDHDILDEEAQAGYLRDVLTLAFAHPSVDGFFVWGFWDGRHWKDNAPFYREDWSEKPALAIWQQLVYQEWWTGDVSLETDAEGWVTVPAAFHGDYRIEVTGYDTAEMTHGPGQTDIVLHPPDSFQTWLDANGMESTTDPDAEDPGTGYTYDELYIMGASENGGQWQGLLQAAAPVMNGSGDLMVDFEAQPGRRYILQKTPTLTSPDWQDVDGAVIEQEGEQQFQLPAADSSGFYRIKVELQDEN